MADIIIIGAGPGGYEMAAEAAGKGLDVVIVERDELGGTCLNRGCIPTKALCASANAVSTVLDAERWGITTGEVSFDYGKAAQRKDEVVAQLRSGVEMLLNRDNITIVKGEARIVDNHTVAVSDETYMAKNIVIATGSEPRPLRIAGAELAIDSDRLLSLESLPESICVIGGGVIGMEFAAILNAYGVAVTVIEYCKEILPPFDKDIAKRLRQSLSKRGVNIITQAAVDGISRCDDGMLQISYEHKGKAKSESAAMVLMSVGRRAVLPEGIENAGVMVSRGFIEVDEHMQAADGVYAIGDVNGKCMLAHAATAQGRVALAHILDEDCGINLNIVPSAVFTTPELAMVGMTEQQCADAGLEVDVKKSFFRANGKAVAMGESEGLVKLLVERESGRIAGCHICGPHAADLIQEVATIMAAGLPAATLSRTIHGHPTLSEVLPMAAH